jgi:hypothetical protein
MTARRHQLRYSLQENGESAVASRHECGLVVLSSRKKLPERCDLTVAKASGCHIEVSESALYAS